MKYFTPELFVRFSSPNADVASAAAEEWESVSSRYRRHLKKIRADLPESVREFVDRFDLHDADVFGPAKLSMQTMPWSFQDIVLVVQNRNTLVPEYKDTLMMLQYATTAEPTVDMPLRSDSSYESLPVWLYDEIDVLAPGSFSHEILLSNGRVIRLPFRDFHVQIAKILAPARVQDLKSAVHDQAASA